LSQCFPKYQQCNDGLLTPSVNFRSSETVKLEVFTMVHILCSLLGTASCRRFGGTSYPPSSGLKYRSVYLTECYHFLTGQQKQMLRIIPDKSQVIYSYTKSGILFFSHSEPEEGSNKSLRSVCSFYNFKGADYLENCTTNLFVLPVS